MNTQRVTSFVVGLLALGMSVAAGAQTPFARAEDAVKYRQGTLFALSHHFTRIGAMVNGRVPYDARAAVENAELVAVLAKLPAIGFGPGTQHVSRGAKPEIWTEQARFKEQNDHFVVESARLLAAAKTNNLDQLKAAYASTAATCKSCHDAYRNN
ncbi:cytochrome c [Ramlibacter sp. WS9]|uniref:c-type cytochrome n=1 Tax=Ramlibacter sp. WS9 TaxID=1882741 RepID=UPI0018EEBAFA|nr:cytochrome c [Ramlibacter sp. WS9]